MSRTTKGVAWARAVATVPLTAAAPLDAGYERLDHAPSGAGAT